MAKIGAFEEYSLRYDEWFNKNKFVYESELEAVRSLLPKSGKGVEIGVGTGRFAIPLGIKTGVEPSKKMREIARERGIEALEGIAEELPFADEQFDYALMVTTICFVDDLDLSIKEAHRVLKTGGHLIIGFIDKNSSLGKIYQSKKDKSIFYKEATFYSVDDVLCSLEKVGFKNIKAVQTIFHEQDKVDKVKEIGKIIEGYGKGSFIVLNAEKQP